MISFYNTTPIVQTNNITITTTIDNVEEILTIIGHQEYLFSNEARHLTYAKSTKQKLNTKSSTEAELVGVSEYLPYNIWLPMFMKEQGYDIKTNLLAQDNQSAIKMEMNGRNSCTGNTRHINIRYFFVKDRVDKKEITIGYCPTECMLVDFFTKSL